MIQPPSQHVSSVPRTDTAPSAQALGGIQTKPYKRRRRSRQRQAWLSMAGTALLGRWYMLIVPFVTIGLAIVIAIIIGSR